MNYQDFYESMSEIEKELKDSVAAVTKFNKAVAKAMENGNMTDLKKALDSFRDSADALNESVNAASECAESFDVKEYFMSGDFAEQMTEVCSARGIDVIGSKGVYEMFPYKVRVQGDEEHFGEVYVNRKKVTSSRPEYVADYIAEGREKLYKAKFNEVSFMGELAEAYDTTILKNKARSGSNQMLTKIYKSMVPMARARKDYDMLAFSFDLARLYELGPDAWVTKTGRRFTFGTSRDGQSGIRVISSSGVESYITTLKAFDNESE